MPSTVLTAARDDAAHLGREGVLALGGLLTTAAVILGNHALRQALDFDFLSLSFWFVIPAGAVIGGMGAAAGYYFAARWTQTMPSRHLLWQMLVIALGAWYVRHWLAYATLTFDDGTRARDLVGFWTYLSAALEHQSLTIRARHGAAMGSTGELGPWGYAREALQVVGFLVGGGAVYGWLTETEACEACRRYTKVTPIMQGVTAAQFDDGLAAADVDTQPIVEAAVRTLAGRPLHGLTLSLLHCEGCRSFWVRPAVVHPQGKQLTTTRLPRFGINPELAGRIQAIPSSFRTRTKGA